jgi:hypothetical protein
MIECGRPVSVPGSTPDYEAALPEPTQELCGEYGVYARVGNLIYRGTYNAFGRDHHNTGGHGSWAWVAHA